MAAREDADQQMKSNPGPISVLVVRTCKFHTFVLPDNGRVPCSAETIIQSGAVMSTAAIRSISTYYDRQPGVLGNRKLDRNREPCYGYRRYESIRNCRAP